MEERFIHRDNEWSEVSLGRPLDAATGCITGLMSGVLLMMVVFAVIWWVKG